MLSRSGSFGKPKMKDLTKIAAAACVFCAQAASAANPPEEVHVIDVGGGAPCATIEAALTEVAAFRSTNTTAAVEVRLSPGDYAPAGTLCIGRAHARKEWGALTLRAADRSHPPRILGGSPVTGWTKSGFRGRSDVWTADVAALNLPARHKLFFYNGRCMEPARYPNVDPAHPYTSGWAFATPPKVDADMRKGVRFSATGLFEDEIFMNPADDRHWANPGEGWVIAFPRHNWWNRALPVTNAVDGVLMLGIPHKEIPDRLFPWDRWCIQGVAEELDAPGEWYLDRAAGKMHFITPDGSDPNTGTASVARHDPILRIEGCSNVDVIGLELTGGRSGVSVNHADDVRILGCSIHDIGFHDGNAVWLMGHRVRLADCDIFNIGGHGVFVQEFPTERRVTDRMAVAVENNYIHHCGRVNSHGIGIWLGGQGVKASHNLMHDLPRCAIFGYGRFCEISYNRIRHVNVINDDTGAIYGSDWCTTGTKVCYNRISDSIGFQRGGTGEYAFHRGACGIYPDEGCGALAVYGNLIERCHHAAMHLHNGRWITISNNVFVSNGSLPTDAQTRQLSLQTWDSRTNGYFVAHRREDIARKYHDLVDQDPAWLQFPDLAQAPDVSEKAFLPDGTMMMGVQVKNNIFYYPDQGTGMAASARDVNPQANPFDGNVYWPGDGNVWRIQNRHVNDGAWSAWQALGQDVHSVIADPLFTDAANGDYRLKADSPAFTCGFRELPYSEMGLQRTEFRPDLPTEAPGLREHPEWLE